MHGAKFTFPSGSHINEIPLWINFASISYNQLKTRKSRNADPRTRVGNASMTVSVPFDGNFANTNNLNYTSDAAEVLNLMGIEDPTSAENIRLKGLSQMLQDSHDGARNLKSMPAPEVNTPNVYMSVDMMDTMFVGGGRRGYEINFDMIARSAEDSKAAGRVCGALSSQCWPLLNPGSPLANGNAKLLHPDIWVIYLSDQPCKVSGSDECDNTWNDGIGPQLCVLQTVTTQRQGGQNSRILTIKDNGTFPQPLYYKVSLSFVELEPAIQSSRKYETINRSTAFGGMSDE